MRAFLLGIIASLALALGAAVLFPGLARSSPVYVMSCSGTYLGKGYVLTAGHCVQGETETILRQDAPTDADDKSGWTAKVVLTDHLHDIAIVKFDKVRVKNMKPNGTVEWNDEPITETLPFAVTKVGCTFPKMRQHYVMKGWPAGMYAETIGYIAGDRKKRAYWPESYLIAVAGFFGSSGSGVYNQITDTVDGVMVGMIPGSGLMIMVPTAVVCNIIPREIP
jgi:hypothetical protein